MAFCQEHVSLRYFDMIQRNNFLVTQITICLVCFVSEFRVTTYIFPPNVLYYPFNLNGHLSFNQTFHGLPWNWPVKKAVLLTELWSDTKQSRYFMFKYLPFLPCLHIYQLLPTMWNKGGGGERDEVSDPYWFLSLGALKSQALPERDFWKMSVSFLKGNSYSISYLLCSLLSLKYLAWLNQTELYRSHTL